MPASPPEVIPVGLATKLGGVVASLFALVSLVSAVLDGDHSQETVISLILAAVTVFVLMGGRYAQAALKALGEHLGPAAPQQPSVTVENAPVPPDEWGGDPEDEAIAADAGILAAHPQTYSDLPDDVGDGPAAGKGP